MMRAEITAVVAEAVAVVTKSLLGFWSSSRKLAIFWLDKTRKPEFSLS
jgi:hypothetical protein